MNKIPSSLFSNVLSKYKLYNNVLDIINLRKDIRFQVIDNAYTPMRHRSFFELNKNNLLNLFKLKEKILRYSIETPHITEFRGDIDADLKTSLRIAKDINNKLKSVGIEANFYYSGGKGIHFHSFISLSGLNLKYNDIKIDIKAYEEEFKLKKGSNLDLINLRNVERMHLKQLLAKELFIYQYLDINNSFSTKTLLGMEGYSHRKTGKRKILLDLSLNEKELFDFINENSNTIIFKPVKEMEIFILPQELKNELNEKLNISETINFNKTKINNVVKFNKNSSNYDLLGFKELLNKLKITNNTLYFASALLSLQKKHNIDSRTSFFNHCGRIIFSESQNEEVLYYFFNMLNNNLGSLGFNDYDINLKVNYIINYSNNSNNKVLFTYIRARETIFSYQDFFNQVNLFRSVLK